MSSNSDYLKGVLEMLSLTCHIIKGIWGRYYRDSVCLVGLGNKLFSKNFVYYIFIYFWSKFDPNCLLSSSFYYYNYYITIPSKNGTFIYEYSFKIMFLTMLCQLYAFFGHFWSMHTNNSHLIFYGKSLKKIPM